MECSEVREKLNFYIDQMLDENTLELVDAHLSHCACCKQELAVLEMLVSAVADIQDVETPTELRSNIMAAIGETKSEESCCEEVAELLTPYIDHELTTAQEARVRSHLLVCDACSSYVSNLRALVSATGSIDTVSPPSDLRERIAAATTQKKTVHLSLNELLNQIISARTFRWAGGAVAAGVVTFGVLAGMSNTSNQVRQAAVERSKPLPVAAKLKPAEPEKQANAYLPIAIKLPVAVRADEHVSTGTNNSRHFKMHGESVAELKRVSSYHRKSSKVEPVKTAMNVINKPVVKQKPVSKTSVPPEPTEVASVPEVTTPAPEVKPETVNNEKPKLIRVAAAPTVDLSDTKELINKLKSEAAMRRNNRTGGITIVSGKF